VDCLLEHYMNRGVNTSATEDEKNQLVLACTAACGGRWEPANLLGAWIARASCDELASAAVCRGDLEEAVAADGERGLYDAGPIARAVCTGQGVAIMKDLACQALAGQEESCLLLDEGDARSDCLLGVTVKKAVLAEAPEKCRVLPLPAALLCDAVSGGTTQCSELVDSYRGICVQHRSGRPDSDPAWMLLAVSERNQDLCREVLDIDDRGSCMAAVTGRDEFCPRYLEIPPRLFARLGRQLEREEAPPQTASVPGYLPLVYGILALLAVLFWFLLPIWAYRSVKRAWKASHTTAAALFLMALLSLVVRLLWATPGPMNFVEYERVFVPGSGDLQRLAYAGQALLVRPLFALFGPSLELVFCINSIFMVLAVFACHSICRIFTGNDRAALVGALLVSLNPVSLRLAATASETAGFAFLALLFIDMLLQSLERDRFAMLAAVVLTPLLASYRPEGVFMVLPCVIALARHRTLSRGQICGLAAMGTLFLFFLYLFVHLSPPHIRPGLFLNNGREFVGELFDPRLFSPVLVLAGLLVLLVSPMALVRRWRRHLPAAASALLVPAWIVLLLVLWSIQGTEGNEAFGSSRYLVILVPWLAISVALAYAALEARSRTAAGLLAAVVLLSYGPHVHLVALESNMQKEYLFMKEEVKLVSDGALVVLPTAPESGEQYSPENGFLALLSMKDAPVTWKSLDEMQAHLQAPGREGAARQTTFFLHRGFYFDTGELTQLGRHCTVSTVLRHSVASVPDVAFYRVAKKGNEVELALYRVDCE